VRREASETKNANTKARATKHDWRTQHVQYCVLVTVVYAHSTCVGKLEPFIRLNRLPAALKGLMPERRMGLLTTRLPTQPIYTTVLRTVVSGAHLKTPSVSGRARRFSKRRARPDTDGVFRLY
jgi:hypothetical protein